MATYTITLKEIVDLYALDGATNLRDKIELARTKIFDFDYPFYDETKRADFETDFIRNFFMREIGFETEELWKFQLENYLRINMGYWNNLFKSELIQFNPLDNTKTDSTHDTTNDQTMNGSSETKGNSNGTSSQSTNGSLVENDFQRHLESDTPDTRLSITANDGQGVIEYANRIDEDTNNNSKTSSGAASGSTTESSDATSTASQTTNETESAITHKEGKIGVQSFSKMLQEYRETFLRIEKEIFKEMNQLFMLVY
jgi:hypothetical protein